MSGGRGSLRKAISTNPATSELWDHVFGFISATGKNCQSPSMDPSMQQTLALMLSHPAVVDKTSTDKPVYDEPSYETANLIDQDHRLIEQGNQETLDNIQLDSVVDQDFLQQVHQIVTGVPLQVAHCQDVRLGISRFALHWIRQRLRRSLGHLLMWNVWLGWKKGKRNFWHYMRKI